QPLGHGGMGEVYLARHPELGRLVAVKVLGGNLAEDETAIQRFRQEAMAACRIGHDAIVEILDIGRLPDGRHYYVMEHLQGQSLHTYLETAGPLPPPACLELLRPVVGALAAAHVVGIVHRDIKPDNLF
ncbi:MAG: serine/threonine-protein kinase, partial [Anaerolineae bacterium]